MILEVTMPKYGQTMEEGKVVRWLKKEGDFIKKNEVYLEIEGDKSTIEVEADFEGRLHSILVDEETVVPCGTLIAKVEVPDGE
jgi:pyruvate dehydrogenase E2 component (dihydrolipoamide acetyltransferase)